MRTAIAGCGFIADIHVEALRVAKYKIMNVHDVNIKGSCSCLLSSVKFTFNHRPVICIFETEPPDSYSVKAAAVDHVKLV